MPKVSGMHKLLIISGPTATGKTKLAVALAKTYHGELISADSRQVYRGIDVISGKDKNELEGIPLWLTDVASVHEQFSVSLFHKLAMPVIDAIYARGKLPIIVGGTGLYIQSIIAPPETIDIPPDSIARERWDALPVPDLQRELRQKDAERFARMNISDRNNARRLIRALEVAKWQEAHPATVAPMRAFDVYWIGLQRDMSVLCDLIAKRVDLRWDTGALDEQKKLPPTFTATGVTPIRAYLQGERSETEAKAAWVREEVSYAKRQMTWFRKQPDIHWFDAGAPDVVRSIERNVGSWYT